MCFGGKTPSPKAPPAPPTERDGQLDGLRERQRASALESTSGATSTMLTQDQGGGSYGKPRLGS